MMKQNQIAVPSAPLSLFAARSLAVWVVIAQCLMSAHAAEVLAAKAPNSRAAQLQEAAYVPQGRQMERYKAFVGQAELPSITITNSTVIAIGGTVRFDVTRLARLTTKEREALAGQFGVPAEVIGKLAQHLASGSTPGADQLVQELRRAVVDYRFLKQEWERYSPPAEGQATKRDAVAALQAGDINKAWELYDGLRKPQAPAIGAPAPPTNLRVVSSP